jgi:hypothetical protein
MHWEIVTPKTGNFTESLIEANKNTRDSVFFYAARGLPLCHHDHRK